jgi:hypothetical protein
MRGTCALCPEAVARAAELSPLRGLQCSVGGVSYGQGTTETERAAAGRAGGAPAPARSPAAAAAGARPEASGPGSPGAGAPAAPGGRRAAGAPGPAGGGNAPAAAAPAPSPTKGFNFRDARLMGGAWRREARPELLREFFRALAVCHTVVPDGAPRPQCGSRSARVARGEAHRCARALHVLHVSALARCHWHLAAQHTAPFASMSWRILPESFTRAASCTALVDICLDIRTYGHVATYFFRNINALATPRAGPEGPERMTYQAESPDEAALVAAARAFGFVFHARTSTAVLVREGGADAAYEVLNILEFDSTRKRMSVICRTPEDRIMLYCKARRRRPHACSSDELMRVLHTAFIILCGLRTPCGRKGVHAVQALLARHALGWYRLKLPWRAFASCLLHDDVDEPLVTRLLRLAGRRHSDLRAAGPQERSERRAPRHHPRAHGGLWRRRPAHAVPGLRRARPRPVRRVRAPLASAPRRAACGETSAKSCCMRVLCVESPANALGLAVARNMHASSDSYHAGLQNWLTSTKVAYAKKCL